MGESSRSTRLSFDRLADIFDDQRGLPPAAVAALHRAFGELAGSGVATLIEPGAGTGRIAIPAIAAGLRVTAVDISRPMLDALARRLEPIPELAGRCTLLEADATALPFPDGAFDAGILAQVLYLLPDWPRALGELSRVVRPGGPLMLLQERTRMSTALSAWDAAWREAVARAGHTPIPQEPDDAAAVAALAALTGAVAERDLATWDFGQTVAEALAGLDRLRPLYETLPDAAWADALAAFRRWRAKAGIDPATRLDGTVTLTLVTGRAPSRS